MTDMLTRALGKASSFNAEARTIDLVFASETPVRRRGYEGAFDEVLAISRQAIDASRLDNMALLDGHDAYSGLDSRLGSIEPGSLRFEGTKAIVTAKISRNAKGDQLVRDLEDGHGLPVSVGYRIDTHERREAAGTDGVATLRAIRWTPLEISIVSIPADATARTRSNRQEDKSSMRPNSNYNRDAEERSFDLAEHQRRQEENANRKLTVGEARSLAKELLSIGGAPELEAPLQAAIQRGMTGMQVREAYLGLMVEREERSPTFPVSDMRNMVDRTQEHFNARRDALVARMTGKPPEGAAREFMGSSLIDHARALIEAQGIDTRGMTREEVMGYSSGRSYPHHTTSDFPNLLQGAGERVLMDAYQLAQSPLKTVLSRRSTATDFRAKTKLKVSDADYLEKVSETGEITATTRSEAAESYKIESYGRIFSLSFQAIVNDDLGAFTDWSIQAGRMSALTENKVLLDLLLANSGAGPKMGETNKYLFHADHGNLAAAGTALDETNLAVAILAFRKQTALKSGSSSGARFRIGIAPRYLLVGPELEVTAQKLLASITPATTADATPEVIKSLVPVVEPNLDGKSWRLFADPAQQAVFEWSYLEGHEGPQLATQEVFHQLGTSFRAVLHFGAGAIDFRGAYLNPGL